MHTNTILFLDNKVSFQVLILFLSDAPILSVNIFAIGMLPLSSQYFHLQNYIELRGIFWVGGWST